MPLEEYVLANFTSSESQELPRVVEKGASFVEEWLRGKSAASELAGNFKSTRFSMKEKKQLYEGMYILNAALSEDARQKCLERITQGLLNAKGRFIKSTIKDEKNSPMKSVAYVKDTTFYSTSQHQQLLLQTLERVSPQ